MFKKLMACTALSAITTINLSNPAYADSETNINHVGHEGHANHAAMGHSFIRHDHSALKASDYGPVGVMGDHMHDEGSFMLSYRYKKMLMKGMMDGDSDITPSAVVAAGGQYGYMMTPTRMNMDMHMIGGMYGVSDDLTIMAMGHYMENRMDMLNRMNVRSKMETEGFGDTTISALIKLYEDYDHAGSVNAEGEVEDENESEVLHATIGLSLPTGSTDERGNRMGAYGNLPYAMQLGSGTYDPIIGLTYTEQEGEFAFGAQANAKIRMGKNNEGYRRGNEYILTSWISKDVTDFASISARVEGKSVGDINGADQNTFGLRNAVPTFNPDNYGGETVSLGFGMNLYQGGGVLEGHKLSLEYILPVYQSLHGPQMQAQQSVVIGWSWSF